MSADPIIDIMAAPSPTLSRWDRGDGAAAIRALDDAMAKAGVPDALEAPKRLLQRAEELGEAARQAKTDARDRLERATRALAVGEPVDAAAYGRVLAEIAPWLDEDSAAMHGMMDAVHRVRGNATATTFGMADGLYAKLQVVCGEVVAEIAAVPALGRDVWSATTTGQTSSAAMRQGRELEWGRLVRLGERFDQVHAAAALLRETGAFQAQLIFPGGCLTELGVMFLDWKAAAEGLPPGAAPAGSAADPCRLRPGLAARVVPGAGP